MRSLHLARCCHCGERLPRGLDICAKQSAFVGVSASTGSCMKLWLSVWALVLSLASGAYADVPADRLATLVKGVNIISVFTDTPLPRIYADLQQIKQAGLR